MSKKEWWIAAGTMSVLAAVPGAAQQQQPPQVGVVGSVNPQATGSLANAQDRVLFVGNQLFQEERIVTGAAGQTHVLFLDQSSLTVGPNSEVVLDRFVYDPDSDQGQLSMSASRGVARYIGGKISKKVDVTIRTPTATIGIRGGITMAEINNNGTSALFLHGQRLTLTGRNGGVETITRPGFFSQVGPNGGPTPAGPPPPGFARNLLNQFAGPSRQTPTPPGAAGVGGSNLPPGQTSPTRIINLLTPPGTPQQGDQLANRHQIDSGRTLDILRSQQSSSS